MEINEQKQLDKVYDKIALRENLTPYEYDMILEEKKKEIEELQEQCANTKELMEIIDKQDQTIRNYQDKFNALSDVILRGRSACFPYIKINVESSDYGEGYSKVEIQAFDPQDFMIASLLGIKTLANKSGLEYNELLCVFCNKQTTQRHLLKL